MRQATHFIEVYKTGYGLHIAKPVSIDHIGYALSYTKVTGFTTIVIFKIYQKVKPANHD